MTPAHAPALTINFVMQAFRNGAGPFLEHLADEDFLHAVMLSHAMLFGAHIPMLQERVGAHCRDESHADACDGGITRVLS